MSLRIAELQISLHIQRDFTKAFIVDSSTPMNTVVNGCCTIVLKPSEVDAAIIAF